MPSHTSSDWSLTMATGGVPLNLPYSSSSISIFSQDGRYSIITLSHQIRVYFISTRQCIRTIDIDLVDLVDIKLDVTNSNHILLFKSNGEIITVNWKEKVSQPIISTIKMNVSLPVLSIIQVKHLSIVFVTGKKDKKSKSSPHTRYITYFDRNSESTTTIAEVPNSIEFSTSLDCKKIVFVTSQHEVVLIDLSILFKKSNDEIDGNIVEEITKETIPFPFKSQITSVAVSNDSIIAIGTFSGTIQILFGGLIIAEKPQRLLKWHVGPVRALRFSADNNYLISGGLEKVLVFWQLETDKKQFLPRLNGSIEKISIDNNKNDYISLLLRVSSSLDEDNFEVLVLSQIDLVSRLAVNTIRPKFNNQLKTTLVKTKKKYLKSPDTFDKLKIRYDYSCIFEVHPKSKNLYFPNGASIQAFDLIKNEQSFIQHAAPVITTGKVRSETKLIDPNVTLISFTHDGEWMCTFDEVLNSEIDNLLSKNDKQYALKFWKFIESSSATTPSTSTNTTTNSINNKTGHWEPSTKILDPHGNNSQPVLSIIPAPTSYFSGLAFLTADNKGGLRIWRPTAPKEAYTLPKNTTSRQTAWTLRKSKAAGALASEAVDVCWSDDGSIIFLAHECTITPINARTFEEIGYDEFKLPAISGSRIRSVKMIDSYLVVLSKTRISCFDLLTGEMGGLVAKVNTTLGGKNLMAIDPVRKLICLGLNYYKAKGEEEFGIGSKLLVFKPDQLKPVHVEYHKQAISSIRYFNSSFVFVDLDYKVGTLHSSAVAPGDEISQEIETGLVQEINNMLTNARATVEVINSRNVSVKTGQQNGSLDTQEEIDESMEFNNRAIDLHTFQPIFQNIEGVQIETLFDRIVKVLK
ncbi:NAN1 [[Candida] subhashii]|uniref:NAN1 n=1 Tax=[Candida] subhashii TaxID=561895 RepID=A0A8J5UGX4_9ASCO|nr:NAN1 [[Candida] subhashii]KAG7662763.1 NAN1 [[Candida] subhashii]